MFLGKLEDKERKLRKLCGPTHHVLSRRWANQRGLASFHALFSVKLVSILCSDAILLKVSQILTIAPSGPIWNARLPVDLLPLPIFVPIL